MRPSRGLEQLDGEVADDAELLGDAQRQLLGLAAPASRVEAGRGRDHGVADAVDLDGLDDRVGDGLAVRGADDVGGQLAGEVDLLLGEDGHAGAERVGGLLGGVARPTRPCRRSRRGRS